MKHAPDAGGTHGFAKEFFRLSLKILVPTAAILQSDTLFNVPILANVG